MGLPLRLQPSGLHSRDATYIYASDAKNEKKGLPALNYNKLITKPQRIKEPETERFFLNFRSGPRTRLVLLEYFSENLYRFGRCGG